MMLEIGLEEIKGRLREIDPSARIDGGLHFPEHPSSRKDLAVVISVFNRRRVGAIYLFWKSENGRVRYRKMATATIPDFNLTIAKVSTRGAQWIEEEGDVRITFSASSPKKKPFTGVLRGKLPEGALKWQAIDPKSSVRFVM